MVANEQGWEADRTYYITYDSTTFRAAWESYFYQPSMRYASFTTAAHSLGLLAAFGMTTNWEGAPLGAPGYTGFA